MRKYTIIESRNITHQVWEITNKNIIYSNPFRLLMAIAATSKSAKLP